MSGHPLTYQKLTITHSKVTSKREGEQPCPLTLAAINVAGWAAFSSEGLEGKDGRGASSRGNPDSAQGMIWSRRWLLLGKEEVGELHIAQDRKDKQGFIHAGHFMFRPLIAQPDTFIHLITKKFLKPSPSVAHHRPWDHEINTRIRSTTYCKKLAA